MLTTLPARAGSYTTTGPTGGMATDGDGYQYPYSGNPYGGNGDSKGDGNVSCAGTITTTYTWTPATGQTLQTDPPPQQVIVMQYCDAFWGDNEPGMSGQCDDGFQDPVVLALWQGECSGTHYTVQSGGPTVTLTCNPSSSADGDTPSSDWTCGVRYSVSVYPITIDISGGIGPTSTKHFMIGQGVSASLNKSGLPDFQTDTYNWSVSGGNPFDNYVASNSSASYYPLFSIHLNGGPSMSCYFAKPDTATFTCQANLAGQSVTVTRDIILEKPSAELSVDIGNVESKGSYVQLIRNEAGAGGGNAVGIQWTGQVLTPSGFSDGNGDLGQWNWTQLITQQRKRLYLGSWEFMKSHTVTPPDTYGLEFLDGEYPYGSFWYPADDTPNGNADSPLESLPNDPDYTEVNAHDSFRDYFMYLPPGSDSVVVPLKRVNWYWQFDATQSGGTWSLSGVDAQWSFDGDFPDHPVWGGYLGMGSLYYDSGSI